MRSMKLWSEVAIIGSGFSGIMTTLHLQRYFPAESIKMFAAEKGLGGLAYGHPFSHSLLNVPHANMSAWQGHPAHFSEYVKLKQLTLCDGAFARRRDYQGYLDEIWRSRSLVEPTVECVQRLGFDADSWIVSTTDGSYRARAVVLATGNGPPTCLPWSPVVQDIWADHTWIERSKTARRIVVVGSGLTAVDVVWELHALGYQGEVILLSRHGLLPKPYDLRVQSSAAQDWTGATDSVRAMLAEFSHEESGVQKVSTLRPITPLVWSRWSLTEQRRFLRHVRAYWDVARHRIPPTVNGLLTEWQRERRLTVKAARISSVESRADGSVAVRLRPRGKEEEEVLSADMILNCTGPRLPPLIQQLVSDGIACLDPHGLGLAGDLLGQVRSPKRHLYAVGPTVKGVRWECTAVPELRALTSSVAETIVKDIHGSIPLTAPLT